MYSSPTPLPPPARQPQQGPLFHPLPAAEHASSREEDDEEEASYHPDPLPPPPLLGVVGDRLFASPSSPSPEEAATIASVPHPMSTVLALAASPAPLASPDHKTTENGANGEADAEAEDDKKREREHKKRSKNWTRPETLKLIGLRKELEPRFAKSGRKTELWDEIADNLQRERIARDAQQCRDKWEKLTAGYKEVRDGVKNREDNPFYDELHQLLSVKPLKREREREKETPFLSNKDGPGKEELSREPAGIDGFAPTPRVVDMMDKDRGVINNNNTSNTNSHNSRDEAIARESFKDEDDDGDEMEPSRAHPRKKRKGPKPLTGADVVTVQNLLEHVIVRQQRFFRELLDSMERKEQMREQLRQEKEDKYRAEEKSQRAVFNNAMITLTQKLVGDRVGTAVLGPVGAMVGSPEGPQGPKRRSKNWKRAEVLQLIKLRGEMDSRFVKSTRRAALWEELAELLAAQGIKRDGKQCREKWDKLQAEYKDVQDGKRDQEESPYFAELTAIIGRPAEAA